MIRTIYWFTAFWIYQFISIFFMLHYLYLGKRGKLKKQADYLHKVSSKWARDMIRFTGSKVEVKGMDNIPQENVLYVSNHQGNFDVPLLMGHIPKLKGFVAKVELKKMPMVNKWMEGLGCIFINRNDPKQSLRAILEGIDKLKKGHTLVVFPEGTRSKGKKIGVFKKGSMKLALKSNVPIVPITINGTYKLLEEKKRIKPSNITIQIHKPIYVDTLTQEEKSRLNDTVYDIIQTPLLS